MLKYKITFAIIILFIGLWFCDLESFSQNLDLHTKYSSGKYFGMAGSGVGNEGGINTFDINPGSLGFVREKSYSVSYNINLYSYYLSRENADMHGVYEYNWNKLRHNFDNILVVLPGKNKVSFGGGIIRKLMPYVQNESRALTMSKLFEQETYGGIYALTISSAYKINDRISVGINLYGYYGITHSEIHGDLHGADLDKWAVLKNYVSGFNFRAGLLYSTQNYNVGLVYETPYNLIVVHDGSLSDDRKYEYLFPDNDRYKWKRPAIIQLGVVYKGIKNSLISLDAESRFYQDTEIDINVWEYAGEPDWKTLGIVRVGVELFPFNNKKIPFRAGYAYIPQLYSSNTSYGSGYVIDYYENTSRVVRQLVCAGFSFPINKIICNIGLAYSYLNWDRKIQTLMVVEEDYFENNWELNISMLFAME